MRAVRLSPHLSRTTVVRARALRRSETPAESRLRYALREKMPEAKFRRQVPMGPYFADLVSHRCRLVVEVDGGQHGETVEQDAARTRFLNGRGYKVLRFWNNEVMDNLDGVLERIDQNLPSPLAGEGGLKGRMRGARPSRAPASKAGTPHPDPLPQGERACSQPPVGVR